MKSQKSVPAKSLESPNRKILYSQIIVTIRYLLLEKTRIIYAVALQKSCQAGTARVNHERSGRTKRRLSGHFWFARPGTRRQQDPSVVAPGCTFQLTYQALNIMRKRQRSRTLSPTRPIILNCGSLVVGSVGQPPTVCGMRCHSIVTCCRK